MTAQFKIFSYVQQKHIKRVRHTAKPQLFPRTALLRQAASPAARPPAIWLALDRSKTPRIFTALHAKHAQGPTQDPALRREPQQVPFPPGEGPRYRHRAGLPKHRHRVSTSLSRSTTTTIARPPAPKCSGGWYRPSKICMMSSPEIRDHRHPPPLLRIIRNYRNDCEEIRIWGVFYDF